MTKKKAIEKKHKQEVAKVETQSISPAQMIREAVAGKADLGKIGELITLQERYQAIEAKKAYHVAMAAFKANPPKIEKDKKVGFKAAGSQVGYSHASLFNVTEKINTELSKHGLSASWATKQNGDVEVTCKITHVMGHSEETTVKAPADTTGAKNAIQAVGSTITYLCRYSLLCLTGLATYDQDDDGKAAGKSIEYISDEQKGTIIDHLNNMKANEGSLLEYLNIESLDKLLKADYQKALAALAAKKKQLEKKDKK